MIIAWGLTLAYGFAHNQGHRAERSRWLPQAGSADPAEAITRLGSSPTLMTVVVLTLLPGGGNPWPVTFRPGPATLAGSPIVEGSARDQHEAQRSQHVRNIIAQHDAASRAAVKGLRGLKILLRGGESLRLPGVAETDRYLLTNPEGPELLFLQIERSRILDRLKRRIHLQG